MSKRADADSMTFPVGTIIVKESDEPNVADREIFAMAKRGGDYNADGLVGWQWFELQDSASSALTIRWRGFEPPPSEV